MNAKVGWPKTDTVFLLKFWAMISPRSEPQHGWVGLANLIDSSDPKFQKSPKPNFRLSNCSIEFKPKPAMVFLLVVLAHNPY